MKTDKYSKLFVSKNEEYENNMLAFYEIKKNGI